MTNKNRILSPKGRLDQGFSLVGSMLGLLLLGVVAVGGSMLYNDYKQDQVAQARGKQLGAGLAQLDRFARKYQAQLTAGQAITGVVNSSSPTTAELQALGFAASGFSDSAQPGGAMVFQVAREPVGCVAAKCILTLKAVTSSSVQLNGTASAPFAQRIAGYVPNGAGWSNLPTDATRLAKNGTTIPNPLGSTPAIVAAVAWLGNSQASATVPPVSYYYLTLSCGAGYTGQRVEQQSVSTDKWGTVTTGAWTPYSNTCQLAAPTPTGTYTDTTTGSCQSGYTGSTVLSRTCTTYSDGSTSCGSYSTTSSTCTASGAGGSSGPCANGATDPPTCTQPCANGATNPPTCGCTNGATNYPTCGCTNGATNYPNCTFPPPVCLNGANNPPICTFPPPVCPDPYSTNVDFIPEGWDDLYDCIMTDTTYSVVNNQCVATTSDTYQSARYPSAGSGGAAGCPGNYPVK